MCCIPSSCIKDLRNNVLLIIVAYIGVEWMIQIVVVALFFVILAVGALLLYFIKVTIGKVERYFLSREETLVFIGVVLISAGLIFGLWSLFGAGIGMIFTDWILNWERIVEKYSGARPKQKET